MGRLTGSVWTITWSVLVLISIRSGHAEVFPIPLSNYITSLRNHVCKTTHTEVTKYTVKCSFWKWGRCTKYKDKTIYNYFCCDGYQNWYDDLYQCNNAICNRRINGGEGGACTQYYSNDYIKYRTGVIRIQRHSGGSCDAPEQCINCNDGFYGNGGMCDICPKIDHCLHRKCTSPSDNHCAYCDGEIKVERYWRAYTPDTDNMKSCQQACSWRSDSTRCYPGKCAAETSASCVCMQGFTGHHCDENCHAYHQLVSFNQTLVDYEVIERLVERDYIITQAFFCRLLQEAAHVTVIDAPSVTDQQAVLHDLNGRTVENPADLNAAYSHPMPTVWTNNRLINRVDAYFTGVFKVDVPVADMPPKPSSDGSKHYVTDFQYGIIGGEIKFTLFRGSTAVLPSYTRRCQGSDMNPITSTYTCRQDITFNAWSNFAHNDKLYFDMSVKNGGYVRITHREKWYAQTLFKLKGKTHSRQFMYHFDMELPYHACARSGGTSCGQAVTAPDLTDDPSVHFSWDGWTDDLSGLANYEYEIYTTQISQGLLMEDSLLPRMPVVMPTSQSSATFTLTTPGMYMLILHVIDNAGNLQRARKVILFDNVSVVEKRVDKFARVTTASSNTTYNWVVKDTNTVDVIWTNLFINQRHKENQWLNAIRNYTDISSNYDDRFGNRTTAAIDHVNGVVDFWVSFEVYTDNEVLKDSQALTTIKPNIHDQSTSLTVDWEDGDKLNVTVRAIDVMQKYDKVTLTVYRDHSAPVIRDLWLTRGSRTNLSVHSLEDFTTMTIEWETHDFHSGIDSLYWKLYDNYTETVIEHGHEDLISQREDDLASCQATYGGDPGDCYCTPYQGCFHQHFTVTPNIADGAGLALAHASGKHDSDYYIEIQVTNIANLVTTLRKKITIDVSPPHTGVVHDGVQGSLEVDYQQSLNLDAHWDGFFDRESGVKMYVYKFASSCQDAATMVLDSADASVIETTDTDVSHTAVGEGMYYVTVVAFNHALEPSTPVCSDGVTIDNGVTAVREISVETAMVREGLVTDSGATAVWILDSDRSLRQLSTTTAACRAKATVVSDLDLFPRTRYNNQTEVTVDGNTFCDNSTGAPSPVAVMLRKSSSLTVSWLVEDSVGGVFDHEFGLTSTAGGSAAPDILCYISTKQNTHITLHHEDVSTGVEFYIAIKTISKTETESIQTLGPVLLDTTAPTFSGAVTTTLVSDHLVATWTASAFLDTEEYYELFYTFAIGHNEYGVDVQEYRPLSGGATCTPSVLPDCTAALVADLDWDLHGHHTYYVTVRAENSVGLFVAATSNAYIHNVQLAAKGVVLDVLVGSDKDLVPYTDIEDSDFQTDETQLQARWLKFDHPHLDISYRVAIGTTSGGSEIYGPASVASNHTFAKTGLSLVHWQTYYITVEAVTSVGSVSVTSDGVTVVQEGATLAGVNMYDGKPCNLTVDDGTLFRHHEQDNRVRCDLERDYQTSLSTIQAYWTIPNAIRYYTPDAHWAIEEEDAAGGGIWSVVRDFEHLSTSYEAEANDLSLLPGRSYRVALKLCAGATCYAPVYTNGVLILANPPVSGDLMVTHLNLTVGGGVEKLIVQMDRFYDPDIEDSTDKFEAIEKYEWAITDNSVSGRIFTNWTDLDTFTVAADKLTFDLTLTGVMDFSRCKRLSVRGYNKAKLWSVVSRQILDCAAFDPILIKPNTIIDAVGEQDYDEETGALKNGYGKDIFLKLNALWPNSDVDYTPFSNIISAVWPNLRHRNYTFAVLRGIAVDATSYYRPTNLLTLPDPCSHPESISCGNTEKEFANIKFGAGELVHGARYIVCLHADSTFIPQETWTQPLEAMSVCSDGVVVDLTPPTPGNVWIGHVPDTMFQTTLTDIYVNWETFVDVEEFGKTSHSTGIQAYTVSIGTTAGGNDMVDFTDKGAGNHAAFHGLQLQNGHTYYATVTATDFAGRSTSQTSPGVVIDVTTPLKSDKPIVIDRHFNSRTGVRACWIEVFSDLESGIQRYVWALGSEPGYDDILSYTDVGDIVCAVQDENIILDLHEGHAYYVTVRAYNGAGLYSTASSWAITVDFTPPVPGHVYDGKPDDHPANQLDRDFQTDRTYIAAFWEGFHDAHSNIREYSVSIGTCRGCQEVLETQAVGITNKFVLSMKHLGVGLTYYTTVTACNTADLCSSVTSDGVVLDNSPPTAGVVQDGTFAWDIHYQATQTFIGAKWYGFSDPQSGLDHYEWWAGTTRGAEDMMAKQILHLSEVATNPAVSSLPVGQTIYITVRAYNRAGLYVDTISNGFTVDITAPIITKPVLSDEFGVLVSGKLVYRDAFKVTWTAEDQDSHIERQHLSIKAHRNGEFQLSPTQVNGILRDYTFTGLDLHDGVNYYVNLIACNGAGICAQAESVAIFVDSSPPSRGMFSIKTNHASDIQRHVPNSMTWTSRALFLSWIGFADLHSEVSDYLVNVGSTYMAGDLNKVIGEPVSVPHSDTSEVYEEGHIQSAKIDTQDLSKASNTLFIHMWAVNKVGLSSPIIHSMFHMITGGALELVRRCDSYSCLGHCVCAPQDSICHYSHLAPCTNFTSNDNPNSPLEVSHFESTAYTATDMGLGAVWKVSNFDGLQPLWYEWSVGYEILDSPEGVFHQVDKRIWHDAGQNMRQLFLVPREKPGLSEAIAYAFFIRVWYASNTYAIYKSNGVTIMTTAPTPTVIRGSAVTESNHKYSHKDMDYLEYQPFMVSWKNKFLQAATYIMSFQVYLSTMPGGDDVYKVAASFPGTTYSYNFTRFKLDSRIKYYSNIVAYSFSGLHHTESSDGFVIDNVVPVMGTVYDGIGIHDLEYQSSRTHLGATWHGFVDLDAGVKTYYWCVGRTQIKTECTIKQWQAVGLRTAVSANLQTTSLSHGLRVYNKVYAVDGLGQKSDTAVSDGVTVDTTPPIPNKLVHQDATNLAANPSFEDSGGHSIPWDKVNSTDICNVNSTHRPDIWASTWDTCVAVVSSDTNLAKDGRSMVVVRGVLSQDISGLEADGLYRVTLVTSHLPSVDSVIANKEGFVEFGDRHVFLMYTKAYRLDDHGSDTRETISWHLHTFYFVMTSTTATLSVGTLDRGTGMLIDDVQVHHVSRIDSATSDTVNAHVVFLHEWGSIHGSWSFVEAESHITEYLWAIGYKKGGTQVQDFRSVGQQQFAYNNTVTLVHKSEVYITVVATNTAALQGIAYSTPILVDLTPPVITAVNDGSGTGTTELDLDSWEQDEVLVNWAVSDPESGLDFCEWAIGYQPFGNELQTFNRMANNVFTGQIQDVGYDNVEGVTVYSTIRCQNNAGVQAVMSSDGVKISRLSPAVDNVQFTTIALSLTEFAAAPNFQGDTSQVRLKWSGFVDPIGLEGFIFTLNGEMRKMLAYDQEETYVWIHGLELSEGEHDLDISAVNLQYKTSPKVATNLTVFTQSPTTHASTSLDVSWDSVNQELTIGWDAVFTSPHELFYEVSAGSNLGSGDIVQWMETKATSMTLTIPPVITNLSNLRVYVVVRAVTLSGQSTVKMGTVQLPVIV